MTGLGIMMIAIVALAVGYFLLFGRTSVPRILLDQVGGRYGILT